MMHLPVSMAQLCQIYWQKCYSPTFFFLYTMTKRSIPIKLHTPRHELLGRVAGTDSFHLKNWYCPPRLMYTPQSINFCEPSADDNFSKRSLLANNRGLLRGLGRYKTLTWSRRCYIKQRRAHSELPIRLLLVVPKKFTSCARSSFRNC